MLSQVLKTYHLKMRFSQERYSYARRDILIKKTILQIKECFFASTSIILQSLKSQTTTRADCRLATNESSESCMIMIAKCLPQSLVD